MALTKIKTGGIADNAITNAKMADNAIDSVDLAAGSIDNAHLAGSIAVSKTLLAGGTGLTLSTNTLNVDAAQTQITSVGTLTSFRSTGIDDNADALAITIDSSENVGIGTTSPSKSGLDISWGGYTQAQTHSLTIGANLGDNSTRTDNGRKIGQISGAHYDNEEDRISLMRYDADSGYTELLIGGTSELCGATTISFLTAANITSTPASRMTIDSGGKVGIGTASPGDDGLSIAYPGSAPQLQLKMASSGHVHISNNTSDKDMNFATAGTGDMYFAPGGTNHVAFLDSGYVGIGTLSPSTLLHVKGTAAIGAIIENDSDDASLKLDGKDTALYYTNYGSNKWKLYSTNDADKTFYIRNETHSSTAMSITNASSNNVTFAGQVTATGIQFDASGEVLADYEEGTWTPQLDGSSGGDYTMGTGSSNTGRYTKIGNKVFLQANIQWTAENTGYSGALIINGLPFTSSGIRAGGNIHTVGSGIVHNTGYSRHSLVIDPGNTFIYYVENQTDGEGYGHGPSVGSTGTIYGFNISYTG